MLVGCNCKLRAAACHSISEIFFFSLRCYGFGDGVEYPVGSHK